MRAIGVYPGKVHSVHLHEARNRRSMMFRTAAGCW